jgi:hypothetical protein
MTMPIMMPIPMGNPINFKSSTTLSLPLASRASFYRELIRGCDPPLCRPPGFRHCGE